MPERRAVSRPWSQPPRSGSLRLLQAGYHLQTVSDLDLYVDAVSRRRALDPRGGVNVAVLMVIENNDVPRLLEIIRLQDQAIRKIIDRATENEDVPLTGTDADFMAQFAAATHLRVEEIAAHGSKARWGDYVEDEKSETTEDH